MRESQIEAHLTQRVKALGGLCWKFTSPNLRGVPDRVLLMPEGQTYWIELKAPGQQPNRLQQRRHAELRARNHRILMLDSVEAVDYFLEAICP